LEYLANGIRTLKENEKKENRHLEIITLTYPEVNESNTEEEGAPRTLLSGTIEDVGNDLRKIKELGFDHLIFGLTNPDLDWVIDTAKQLSKFTR
jgi:hypothetical protein